MKKELICTNRSQDYYQYIDILKAQGIRHTTKVVNQQSPSPMAMGRGHHGALGLDGSAMYMYYIYVDKKDLEKAQYLINSMT